MVVVVLVVVIVVCVHSIVASGGSSSVPTINIILRSLQLLELSSSIRNMVVVEIMLILVACVPGCLPGQVVPLE